MRSAIAAAALIVLLALSGCATATAGATTEPEATSTPTAETPAPALTAEPSPAEAGFLASVQRFPGLETVTMDDALEVGHYVCAELDSGATVPEINAVTGTTLETNESVILSSSVWLCSAHQSAVEQGIADAHASESPFANL